MYSIMPRFFSDFHSFCKTVLLSVLVICCFGCNGGRKTEPLDIFTPPSLKDVVSEVAELFRNNYRVPVNINVVDIDKVDCELFGDVLFCDRQDVAEQLQQGGCVAATLPISYISPVLVVKRETSENFHSFDDFVNMDMKVAIPQNDPKLQEVATRYSAGSLHWNTMDLDLTGSLNEQLEKNGMDAILSWDYLVPQDDDELRGIPLPPYPGNTQTISVLVLTACKDVPVYQAFLETLTSKAGRDIFNKHNITTVFH